MSDMTPEQLAELRMYARGGHRIEAAEASKLLADRDHWRARIASVEGERDRSAQDDAQTIAAMHLEIVELRARAERAEAALAETRDHMTETARDRDAPSVEPDLGCTIDHFGPCLHGPVALQPEAAIEDYTLVTPLGDAVRSTPADATPMADIDTPGVHHGDTSEPAPGELTWLDTPARVPSAPGWYLWRGKPAQVWDPAELLVTTHEDGTHPLGEIADEWGGPCSPPEAGEPGGER